MIRPKVLGLGLGVRVRVRVRVRAGDLGRMKTEEMLYFPRKEGLLFICFFTKKKLSIKCTID